MKRKLCMIFEAIGSFSAIGRIAMAQVNAALAEGWDVSVVASRLEESLEGRVEWRKLYVPPRLFALKWVTARHFIRKALGNPAEFDVIHGHQPQIAALCDIFQCHFLSRVAHERGCLLDTEGLRRAIDSAQNRIVLTAEDWYFRRWNPATQMVFVSELLAAEFTRLYGSPAKSLVLENAGPLPDPVTEEEREHARAALIGQPTKRRVVGFLGGLTERKGYRELLNAVAADDRLHLLMAGERTSNFKDARLGERMTSLGLVDDIRQLYAACDVFAVPSVFDPCPYVVLEAASRGIPVIATEGVGNAASVVKQRAGLLWRAGESFGALVEKIAVDPIPYSRAALNWAQSHTLAEYCSSVLKLYEKAMNEKSNEPAKPSYAGEVLA